MPISPHVQRLRECVGTDLLLIPSVAVMIRDDDGRILLVRDADHGKWITVGGAIEIDESPADAAVREAAEEANVTVRLRHLLGVAAGPEFRVTYSNGDETAYVSIIYEGEVVAGTPEPDGDEVTEARWFALGELAAVDLSDLTRALLIEVGILT